MRTNIVQCVSEELQQEIYTKYKKKVVKTKTALAAKYKISTRTLGRIIATFEEKAKDMSHEYDYTVTKNEITIFQDGDARTINKTYPKFKSIKKSLIKADFSDEALEETFDLMNMKIFFEKFTLGRLTVDHESGSILYGTFPVDNKVVDVVMNSLDDGDKDGIMPLIKFLDLLLQNPKENVVEELYEFLKHNDIKISNDGLILAWKGVNSRLYDVKTNSIPNYVGTTVCMPRTEVDDDPNRTCSHGLHVGAYEYANNWGNRLLQVSVNPRNVVSVPTDYNGQKMRCCEYFVIKEV